MRALVQRVAQASVAVDGSVISEIQNGLLVFLGVAGDDQTEDADYLLKKIPALRIFPDKDGKMNFSVLDSQGEILVVSQFTLIADTKKGNRPSYFHAAPPEVARKTYEEFCSNLGKLGLRIRQGIFGADMKVALINDGPVTIWLDSKERG